MSNKRVFLIHGWKGFPEGGWRPWLKNELEKRGFSVFVPVMPDTNNPNVDAWLKKLTETVGTPDKNCFLVGHSLGCITVLRYLETLKKNQEIGGTVLVAGRSYSLGKKETETFFKTTPDWKKIRTHCKKFIAIHSDNDYYVPLEESETFRKNLGAKIILKPGMKHFTGDDGVTELPVALESLLKLAGSMMKVEEANAGHIPELVDMWLEFMKEHDTIILGANPKLREHEIKDEKEKISESYRIFLESKIGSDSGAVFIAKSGDEIAGYALIFIKDEIPIYTNKKLGYISDLYVKKDFRKMNVSSALMEKSAEWFRKKGIAFISIAVSPDNEVAHKIYKTWGFVDYKLDMRKKI